jgi:hypothetical protein
MVRPALPQARERICGAITLAGATPSGEQTAVRKLEMYVLRQHLKHFRKKKEENAE